VRVVLGGLTEEEIATIYSRLQGDAYKMDASMDKIRATMSE
jgi:hypothetical protein